MKTKIVIVVALITTLFTSCKKENNYPNLKDGLYAEIETNKGTIIAELNYKKTPMTVANFVSLAEGKNTRVTEEFKGKPFYDGLKFHRVISKANGDMEDFMVQTGDPLGTGSGDAGYKFSDETLTELKHNKPGILSMANSDPPSKVPYSNTGNSNSSQFFITIAPTSWLDGRHTVFGKVVENGMEVVNKIVQDDFIKSVKIIRKGKEAEAFDAAKVFEEQFKLKSEAQTKLKAPYVEMINNAKATGTKLASGLIYKVIQPGTGNKPATGTEVKIEYAGFLEDGTLFDSSIKSVEEKFGKYNAMKDQQNGYSPIPFKMGTKEGLIPGFIEAIEQMKIGEKAVFVIPPQLGYGAQGAGNVIPPNATIIFELEMLSK